jgi:hypothetical protein
VPKAFTASMEEQGRKTLHSHIQIWIEGFHKLRYDLHSECRLTSRDAERSLCQAVDASGGCSLLVFDREVSSKTVCAAFPHNCSVQMRVRQ